MNIWDTFLSNLPTETARKAATAGAEVALDLPPFSPPDAIERARLRTHTSITLRADRMSGAPCVGDSRLTVETIAAMDRETCHTEFPQVTDEQFAAVEAWFDSPYGREWSKGGAAYTATLEARRDRDEARAEVANLTATKKHYESEFVEANRVIERLTFERDAAQEKAKMFDYIDAARDNYLSDLTALRRENEIERATAQREISHLRNEHRTITADLRADLSEARRLHANAVEELARVKMSAPPTTDQILIWLVNAPNMAAQSTAWVKALAEYLAQKMGTP